MSTDGLTPDTHIPVAPSYQVPFAATLKKVLFILVIAVALITAAEQAESILARA